MADANSASGHSAAESVYRILSAFRSDGDEQAYLCQLEEGGKKVKVSRLAGTSRTLATLRRRRIIRRSDFLSSLEARSGRSLPLLSSSAHTGHE